MCVGGCVGVWLCRLLWLFPVPVPVSVCVGACNWHMLRAQKRLRPEAQSIVIIDNGAAENTRTPTVALVGALALAQAHTGHISPLPLPLRRATVIPSCRQMPLLHSLQMQARRHASWQPQSTLFVAGENKNTHTGAHTERNRHDTEAHRSWLTHTDTREVRTLSSDYGIPCTWGKCCILWGVFVGLHKTMRECKDNDRGAFR